MEVKDKDWWKKVTILGDDGGQILTPEAFEAMSPRKKKILKEYFEHRTPRGFDLRTCLKKYMKPGTLPVETGKPIEKAQYLEESWIPGTPLEKKVESIETGLPIRKRRSSPKKGPEWASDLQKTTEKLVGILEKDNRQKIKNRRRGEALLKQAQTLGTGIEIFNLEELALFKGYFRKGTEDELERPLEEKSTSYTFKPEEGESREAFIGRVTSESPLKESDAKALWDQKGGTIEVKIVSPKTTDDPRKRPKEEDENSTQAEEEKAETFSELEEDSRRAVEEWAEEHDLESVKVPSKPEKERK